MSAHTEKQRKVMMKNRVSYLKRCCSAARCSFDQTGSNCVIVGDCFHGRMIQIFSFFINKLIIYVGVLKKSKKSSFCQFHNDIVTVCMVSELTTVTLACIAPVRSG